MAVIVNTDRVERKTLAILRVLAEAREPVGSRFIARELEGRGLSLPERTVRYHLKLLDQRGFTLPWGRDGRVITPQGREELQNARVADKVGLVISRIQLLAFHTTFDPRTRRGRVPINISYFPVAQFELALRAMEGAFPAGLAVSDLVAVAEEGERMGDGTVPPGKVGLATVCSITVNAALLKAGIPVDSRFAGILQIKDSRPHRFVELISYSGSTLDPSEVFIRGRMTDVQGAAKGEGKVLANLRDIPAPCRPAAEAIVSQLQGAGIGGVLALGDHHEGVCQVPVGVGQVGMVLLGGLNPVAAAREAGIEAESRAMAATLDYARLRPFRDLLAARR